MAVISCPAGHDRLVVRLVWSQRYPGPALAQLGVNVLKGGGGEGGGLGGSGGLGGKGGGGDGGAGGRGGGLGGFGGLGGLGGGGKQYTTMVPVPLVVMPLIELHPVVPG